ncbi:acriflavin resistance AcrB/AcrD/AcrF family protein [Arcobacter nitrofigilis DSM 7299]|uniref:Acriflavin resistance AcrB/AcrD/AcrF family protein n=1 Tax=Arcobacter nitrofigilis (strain ATCC 33309 / DSM 7299 / CCUG 15893 / LMG 7604 / NCTC 12251 / CI) TaxID=572480 RepID=D5V2P0_ARCNC|nr:efflux RND transporter permease subunit [Arcobacter nitrofigilis]ADG92472.1 acriflavin resistance AcrB/AcrD/AcrF family protein [Arcobacter nitrofigilis DSM 7299]
MNSINNLVHLCIKNKKNKTIVLLVTLFAFLFSVYLLPLEIVKAKMLPGKDSNTFTVYVDLPTGSSIYQTKKVTDGVVSVLQKEKEVLDSEVFLGTSSPLDFAGLVKMSGLKSGENFAEIVVNILKKHDREEPSFLMAQRLRIEINKVVEKINPNATIKMVEPPAGPPVLAAIVAEIYGDNYNSIEKLAKRVEKVFKKTDGLVDIDIIGDDDYEKYEYILDYEKIKRLGITVNSVTDLLETAFNGKVINTKNSSKYSTQIDLFVRTKQRDFDVENALSSLKVKSSNGNLVPLVSIVKVKKVKNEKTIYSKDLKPMLNVVAETDMVSQIYPLLDARTFIKENFGDEYEVTSANMLNLWLTDKKTGEKLKLVWDGELKVTLDTFRDLGGAFIAALVLIFLLMVVYYRNFALSGIVLLSSFLSIIGVIFGHLFVDIVTTHTFFLTATSLIGFIALIGISSRNALLLIDFTKHLVATGIEKKEAIATSASIRAKPIILTAASIILASILLANDAVFGGLGVSLIFGTVAAVIASIFVVPVLIDNIDESVLRD